MISFVRVAKFALQNAWRNIWLSLITVSMLLLTLVTVNVLIVLQQVTTRAIQFAESRIDVSVYFNENTATERVASAAGYLRGLPQVRDVQTVTSDEALQRFKERHVNDAAILRSLDEIGHNPFGPTLVVKANSAADFPFILEALEHPQFRADIREKDFSNWADIIDRIRTATDRIRFVGLILSGIFLAIASLIVFNTVRMGLFMYREEIGIMKLVGASNWFVRLPFLLEALLYSLFATIIMAALAYPAVAFLDGKFSAYFGGYPTGLVDFYTSQGLVIFLLQFLGLSVISMVATGFAMRKYLRV